MKLFGALQGRSWQRGTLWIEGEGAFRMRLDAVLLHQKYGGGSNVPSRTRKREVGTSVVTPRMEILKPPISPALTLILGINES